MRCCVVILPRRIGRSRYSLGGWLAVSSAPVYEPGSQGGRSRRNERPAVGRRSIVYCKHVMHACALVQPPTAALPLRVAEQDADRNGPHSHSSPSTTPRQARPPPLVGAR
jgi:hypothetical protein